MTAAINKDTVPGIAPTFRFQWEEAQDCYVVLYPEGMVKLSASAGAIMKYIDGESSVGAIVADLKQEFPGADLEADVYKFLEVANENGWIRFK
jgi:pyrroloquinoline quinone biosynthesis protein D